MSEMRQRQDSGRLTGVYTRKGGKMPDMRMVARDQYRPAKTDTRERKAGNSAGGDRQASGEPEEEFKGKAGSYPRGGIMNCIGEACDQGRDVCCYDCDIKNSCLSTVKCIPQVFEKCKEDIENLDNL